MSYLYGDSTPSKLEVNFIEFLRDAVDCCVQVLLADQRIAEGAARTRALESSTTAEIARLQKVGALVPKAFEGTPVGEPASATARCVAEIARSAADIVRAATAAEAATAEAAVTRRDAEAALEREAAVKALEALLIKHDLPEMTSDSDIRLAAGGRYACRLLLTTPFGLDAMMALEVPAGHLLERVVRVDRLAERLDVQVPEIAGWLHKEMKLRAQHLEKHHLVAFARGPAGSTLALRLAPDGTGPGYDLTFGSGGDDEPVRLVRVDEQQKRDEAFEARDADVPKLTGLRDKIAAAVSELGRHRTKILEAKLEGEALQGHAKPSLLVERLIAVLLPETREISARSQSPGELVLRRLLAGDRREEIFLSKRDLQTKLEPLDERHRALFDSLLRDGGSPSRIEPPPAPAPRTEPAGAAAAEGAAPSDIRKTLSPQPIQKSAPAPSPSRLPTPSYGIPSLTSLTQPPPPPAAAGKPSSISEALRAAPTTDDAPLRKTAPLELRAAERSSATALDRPPPSPPPPPASVAGEIGGAPDEKKVAEPSSPHPAT
jgi:hypothetical protein